MPTEERFRPTSRGNVAAIVNNLHTLEYKSGRIDEPAPPRKHNTLSYDHPAQRPKGDRPVPFVRGHNLKHVEPHQRPAIGHFELEEGPVLRPVSQTQRISEESGQGKTELRHVQSAPAVDTLPQHDAESRKSFQRRDAAASPVSSPSPSMRRESLSHKAFAKVRQMSVSPPPLAMPVPRVEVGPFIESTEQYIARKLTERWSPPRRRRSTQDRREGPAHVEAPFVQDILANIDHILLEHTASLRDVIEDSRRVLHDREVSCHPAQENDGVSLLTHSDFGSVGVDDTRISSSVPELMDSIDRAAEHLGLSMPEEHFQQTEGPHPYKTTVSSHPISPAQFSEHHDKCTSPELSPALPPLPTAASLSTVFPTTDDIPAHLSPSPHTHSHHWHNTSKHPYGGNNAPEQEYKEHVVQDVDEERDFLVEQRMLSPSPSLIEYDRFLALADRASRNSVGEAAAQALSLQGRSAAAWGLANTGAAPRRQNTMDRLTRNRAARDELRGKWDTWERHIQQNTVSPKQRPGKGEAIRGIGDMGKRSTGRMVGSAMARQAKEKGKDSEARL